MTHSKGCLSSNFVWLRGLWLPTGAVPTQWKYPEFCHYSDVLVLKPIGQCADSNSQGQQEESIPLHVVPIKVHSLSLAARNVLKHVQEGTYRVDLCSLADTLMGSLESAPGSFGPGSRSSDR